MPVAVLPALPPPERTDSWRRLVSGRRGQEGCRPRRGVPLPPRIWPPPSTTDVGLVTPSPPPCPPVPDLRVRAVEGARASPGPGGGGRFDHISDVRQGDALSVPVRRLRLLRELLQQPLPDPENRGAQQGSARVRVCARHMHACNDCMCGGGAGCPPFVWLHPGAAVTRQDMPPASVPCLQGTLGAGADWPLHCLLRCFGGFVPKVVCPDLGPWWPRLRGVISGA